MTVEIGWQGGSCGVQTFRGEDALLRAVLAYPEVFPALDARGDEVALVRDMTLRASRANQQGFGCRFVLNVTP